MALVVKNPPANAGDATEGGLIPGLERSPEEGMVTHSSILAWWIPLDRGAWRATVHRVAKSQTWPKWFQSVSHFSHSVECDSLWPHGLQHTRPPCPSPTPGVYSHSCPLSRWCHSTISSSVIPFSSCLQSFPASGSFPVSQLFASSGQSIGVSASTSVLPTNIQDWFPLAWTGWISLQSKGLSRVFSNTTV